MFGLPTSIFAPASSTLVSNASEYEARNDRKSTGPKELKPGDSDTTPHEDPYKMMQYEKWYFVLLQICGIFFVTGCGSIGTGAVLSNIAKDTAFIRIKNLYLLMPVLQSLKGNVDTCLAARLSTQANLGNLDKREVLVSQIISNMALVQVQSIVGSLIVSVYSVALGAAVNGDWNFKHALLLSMAGTTTTCVTCFFLDLGLIGLIVLSNRWNINPDNIICPIAAVAADLTTLVVFSTLINITFDLHHEHWWFFIVILAIFIVGILPISVVFSLRIPETKTVLFRGWYVVLVALVFSSLGSLVLDVVVEQYRGYVLFQPVLNGTTGTLATILCTRLSTMLYKSSEIGTFHPDVKLCARPYRVWFHGTPQAFCVRMLIMIGVPGQLIFVFLADYVYTKASYVGAAFVFAYLFVSSFHMLTMMYICHVTVHMLWKCKIDPDNAAIPIVSAVGDFLGSALLAVAFAVLLYVGHEYLHGIFGKM